MWGQGRTPTAWEGKPPQSAHSAGISNDLVAKDEIYYFSIFYVEFDTIS